MPVVSTSKKTNSIPLLSGEEVIFQVQPNPIKTIFFILILWAVGAALAIGLNQLGVPYLFESHLSIIWQLIIYAGVFFLVGLIIFLAWLNTTYTLTNKRVEWQFGIIGKGSISLALDQAQDVIKSVGIFGMIFGYGNVTTQSASLSREIPFATISQPEERANQIEQAISS
jgi:uncharacterized membrane protein YdbT with pleckstrin-like domain